MANFDTPPRLASWCGLSLPLARTQCRHQSRNGKCVSSCCSTSGSLGNTGLPGCASAAALSCSKPINSLHLCGRVGSQPIHSTSTFKLDSVTRTLVEYLSTGAAECDVVASVAQYDRHLKSSLLGSNLDVSRHVDAVSCAQTNRRVARRGALVSSGRSELHSKFAGFAAAESIRKSL